jgi:hypothetical protein
MKPSWDYSLSFDEIEALAIEPVEFLVEPILPRAGLTYFYGAPGACKTSFLMYLTLLGSVGRSVFKYKVPKPFKTLWIDEETGDIGLKEKITLIRKGLPIGIAKEDGEIAFDGSRWRACFPSPLHPETHFILTREMCRGWLERMINNHHPDLIVIDSISKVFPFDERDKTEVAKIHTFLKPLMVKYRVAFAIVHHTRKLSQGQYYRGLEDIRGSAEFEAQADGMVLLEETKTPSTFMIRHTKTRYRKKVGPITFQLSEGGGMLIFEYEGDYRDERVTQQGRAAAAIRRVYSSKEEFKRAEAIEILVEQGHKKSDIINALRTMVSDKELNNEKRGYYIWIKKDDE